MLSGSIREGLRLKGSDMDYMYWLNNYRIIMNMTQSKNYNTTNTTLILSDPSRSPPGFTLLQLLTPTQNREIQSICVRMNDRVYIFSSLVIQLACSRIIPHSSVHGPCGSGNIAGTDFDHACCFVSDFWPQSASSRIERCHLWPNPEVVNDIVRNGCHFVAIGHPFGPNEKEEWRTSFSQAEYRCVTAMNHSQFMTYGLLKLFLKEVINHQIDEKNTLLCSYHMKTTVFWAIQQNTLHHWCPQNILAGFWVCFKLLLKWEYEGICPNFFIPQNNLFLTKVHGSAQKRLFLQLHELYKKGLAGLLQSSSIRSNITDVLYNPRHTICTDECLIKSKFDLDGEFFSEIYRNNYISEHDFQSCVKYLYEHEQLIGSHLTQNQVFMLERLTASILQNTAFVFHNMYSSTGINKQMYIADKVSNHMIKLAAKFGCVSDMFYIAMYYYKTVRYREALSVIEMTKVKLAQPYLMYRYLNRETYIEAVGVLSLSTKMRQIVAYNVTLYNKICYISELLQEQQSALQNKKLVSFIPVFVMLHFLEFLCYRHIDTTLSQAALDDLQALVHHDQGLYINDPYRDIYWEILGICQQITGILQAALYSYQQSLIQYPFHKIQTATQRRIQDVVTSE